MKKIILAILSLSFVLFSENLFGKSRDREDLTVPGLLLTFDDRNMLNWEKQIPLFAKYDAHVTFFIDHFDELTSEQLKALQKLQEAGHAIGCHGLRHKNAVEYCKNNSVEKYISEEIVPAIEIMQKKGFAPTCFAYPQSSNNETIDAALLTYFQHLRSGCPKENELADTEKAFVHSGNSNETRLFYGISFHPKSKTEDIIVQAKRAMDRIKENNELLVLYAHDIRNENENGPRHFITEEALEEILDYAKRKEIKLLSYDELP